MKLNIPVVLFSLFSTLCQAKATVVFEDVPSHLEVGQQVILRWTSNTDLRINELSLWRKSGSTNHTMSHVHDIHRPSATLKTFNYTQEWKIPPIHKRPGFYEIHFEGLELLPLAYGTNLVNKSAPHAVAHTNAFEISGGVTLFPKEIAGIVVGSIAAIALFIGLWVLGARFMRKRKNIAVDLPSPEEGGYTDSRS